MTGDEGEKKTKDRVKEKEGKKIWGNEQRGVDAE